MDGTVWVDASALFVSVAVLAESACSAPLGMLADAGHQVRAVVLSNARHGGQIALGRRAARRATELMSAAEVQALDLPGEQLAGVSHRLIYAVETAVAKYNPDLILTHAGNDQEQDHHAVHVATLRAARNNASMLFFDAAPPGASCDQTALVNIGNLRKHTVTGAHAEGPAPAGRHDTSMDQL